MHLKMSAMAKCTEERKVKMKNLKQKGTRKEKFSDKTRKGRNGEI